MISRWTPWIAVAGVSTLLAAASAMDPGPAGPMREIGGCIAAGLLILTSFHGTAFVRVAELGGRRAIGSAHAQGLLSALAQAALAVAFTLPALVAGWEFGASRADMTAVAAGLAAAALCGSIFGLLMASTGWRAPAGALAAASAAALALWPATLGWAADMPRRFPAPELPPAFFGALLVAVATAGPGTLALRRRIARADRDDG